ncbi:hypothetical protein LDL77_02125 [Flagellimonas marinaquae]|nr:hypothetical protein LDL77_02125 [Allomuricauda aquimarina]
MKNLFRTLVYFLAISAFSCKEDVHYLDDDHPGITPKKYAEGIINVKGRFLQNITMSPDGKEVLLGQTDAEIWRYERILRVKTIPPSKIVIDTPEFVTNFKYEREWMIGEPMISIDNQKLYFVADYPPDYWYSERAENGEWLSPVKMDALSTDKGDWYMSAAKNHTLYFTDGRVHKSTLIDGEYSSRRKVEGKFNELDAGDPCISPNEDYMIFASTRDNGYGKGDIYVCFKNKNGLWSQAYNLGSSINTEHWESAPYISPDEKFLFFSRRDGEQNAKSQDIYWVDMKIIEKIKKNHNLK